MGELVFIDVAAKKRDVTVQEAWDRFVEAKLRAERTLDLKDGIDSGKAYRQFIELYAVRK